MKQYHITTIGNALLDMEHHVSEAFLQQHDIEKGIQTLIDLSTLEKMLDALKSVQCQESAGGASTNSLVAAALLGAQTFYHCQIGQDNYGDTLIKSLQQAHVSTCSEQQMRTQGPTGLCIALITPDAERTMLTYLGVSDQISQSAVDFTAIENSEYFLVEGFQCISDTSRATNRIAMQKAQAAGTKIALSFCDEAVVQYFHPQITELFNTAPIDILFCNQFEAMTFTQTKSISAAIEALKKTCKAFAMTLGAQGAFIYDGQSSIEIAGIKVKATDTLGAGDLFAGSFLFALTQGINYEQAGAFANKNASSLVTMSGPRLDQTALLKHYEDFKATAESI